MHLTKIATGDCIAAESVNAVVSHGKSVHILTAGSPDITFDFATQQEAQAARDAIAAEINEAAWDNLAEDMGDDPSSPEFDPRSN